MHPTFHFFSLTAFALLSSATVLALQSNTTSPAVNCEIVITGLSPSCWDELNMNAWIDNWWATTSSNATNGGATQCEEHELWSTCFLRLGLGVTGRDCSTINTSGENSTCPMPRLGDEPHNPQMFYGVWNIYAINSYATTLNLALQTLLQTNPPTLTTAATTSANDLPRFTNTTQTVSIDIPLRVLLEKETYGFALPATPNAGLLTFLYAYPAMQTYGRFTSVLELVGLLQQRVSQALVQIMSDVSRFLMVADGGAFSTGGVVDEWGLVEALES